MDKPSFADDPSSESFEFDNSLNLFNFTVQLSFALERLQRFLVLISLCQYVGCLDWGWVYVQIDIYDLPVYVYDLAKLGFENNGYTIINMSTN